MTQYAEDWWADARLFIAFGVSCETARMAPPRALLEVELPVVELILFETEHDGPSAAAPWSRSPQAGNVLASRP